MQEDEMLKQLQFFSVASDGRVTLWTLAKSELLHQVRLLLPMLEPCCVTYLQMDTFSLIQDCFQPRACQMSHSGKVWDHVCTH